MLGVGCSVPFINGNQSISRYAFDVRYDWLVPLIKGTRPLRKTCDSLTLIISLPTGYPHFLSLLLSLFPLITREASDRESKRKRKKGKCG